ncbi:peptidase S8 [Pseudohongiella acticola]|uniref:Peptidase S8 n=1 Tax=Pseudohongiella acticola TaxID=1524254 RepID=A0A1E8CG13_9GAMM|nr:S8 family anti-phage peptidase IteS [Pseudohongiella acticola]OFE11411.1 peptidase S8 [Pseudohongiella acticola]
MNKKDYPIKVVEIRGTDHRPPRENQGGSPKSFCVVTEDLRENLSEQVIAAHDYFSEQFERWPDIPAVVKITLKEEALAKSHRPTSLLRKRTCPIIGVLSFGEVLVSASPDGLEKLADEINNTTSEKPIANISAIEKIEPYRVHENRMGSDIEDINASIQENIPLKIHTFDHGDAEVNRRIKRALVEFAQEQGVGLEELKYGTRFSEFKTDPQTKKISEAFESFMGLQSLTPMPTYRPLDLELQTTPVGLVDQFQLPPPSSEADYPIVGVVDSGVCPHSTLIAPWVVGREEYVPQELQDHSHGTMVAGLIAGAYTLNNQDDRYPRSQAKILDVPVFEKGANLREDVLVAILEDVIPKHPEVRVWNLSMGGTKPCIDSAFSDLACFLDEMHDAHKCLFVIAAGNHSHVQKWPQVTDMGGADRVSSPGDSVRALTVGGLASLHNANSLSKSEEPSPFSRRGPGPCFIPKPEVTHYGGNCTERLAFAQTGILTTGANNTLCETLGTSFATPLVSAQAAVLWQYLDTQESPVTPERIKALLIHSALLQSRKITSETVHHYGFGKPGDVIDSLYCEPNAITLMFETDLRHGGHEFERWPFPIADCLNTEDRKFRGQMLMTVVYSPITDSRYKSEYCRTNVDVGLGNYALVEDEDGTRKYKFDSFVPVAPEDIRKLYEKHQIENGFKWSPVKAYYARFPQGKDVETWRLRMKVTRRAELQMPDIPQRATLLLTMRGNTPELPVYNEAIRTMNQAGWIVTDIDQHIRVGV